MVPGKVKSPELPLFLFENSGFQELFFLLNLNLNLNLIKIRIAIIFDVDSTLF